MIADTSAIIAILAEEDDAAVYGRAIAGADVRRLSAASYLECGIILDAQRDPIISRALDELIEEAEFVVEPVTERQARLAREAYADFGKGSGHPAGLNFGDCLSYALALDLREPLLWKGDDFGHTGVRSALEDGSDARGLRRGTTNS
ncbi:type II toxin-antitoxin system VapC family toxin [Mycobacterium sp. 663a-19]|uniref:type II toxin-antitoxin system VapC family toxin n=1 Tax=Mycobacterium sp. 663a-19 TaxID=2986148 RepID=UPI002D1EBFB3|nr:type II toxin-antitoxin system VapC family toxin [Mycobacterium sp. 663a-19]MEB3982505.1 type II toxin-antitoxin system VapC family toxin [Mycobacterium sp. 663a-19]